MTDEERCENVDLVSKRGSDWAPGESLPARISVRFNEFTQKQGLTDY